MENKKLAIKGHLTRGKEVIEILEMFGGEKRMLEGKDTCCFYYIDPDNNLIRLGHANFCNLNNFVIFTLEDFLEKYPYKIGDKCKYNGHIYFYRQQKFVTISNMCYMNDTILYKIDKGVWVKAENLQPFKEEIKAEDRLEIYADPAIDNDSKTDITIDGEKLIAPNGYTVKTATMDGNKLIVEYIKNKPQYPKTFQECYSLKYNGQINLNIGCDILHGAYSEELECLQSLLICRDAYWKIAGEEMGLFEPLEPDFSENFIYAIGTYYGTIEKRMVVGGGILLFLTEEMRDAFFENFKDLIEKCKEFL